jgi:hypothetical protein
MTRAFRALAALAMLATTAVISAGCGDTRSSSTSTATPAAAATGNENATEPVTAATKRDKAVKFAACMRENGYADFPDPQASGEFPTFGISVSPTVWARALGACKELQPPGSFNAHLSPKQLSGALKFAQCIREHGVTDFPDPVNGQPLVDTTRIPSSDTPAGMAILNAAMHKCGHLVATG